MSISDCILGSTLIILKTLTLGSRTEIPTLAMFRKRQRVGLSCSPIFSESWNNFFGSVDGRRVDAGFSTYSRQVDTISSSDLKDFPIASFISEGRRVDGGFFSEKWIIFGGAVDSRQVDARSSSDLKDFQTASFISEGRRVDG